MYDNLEYEETLSKREQHIKKMKMTTWALREAKNKNKKNKPGDYPTLPQLDSIIDKLN